MYRLLTSRVTGSKSCLVTGFMRIRKAENHSDPTRRGDSGAEMDRGDVVVPETASRSAFSEPGAFDIPGATSSVGGVLA